MKYFQNIVILFLVSPISVFASSGNIDLLEYKIQEVKTNNKEIEDGAEKVKGNISELEKKYAEYNSALDYYLKQVKLKEDAYDLALNQIKYWVSIIGGVVVIFAFLGFKDIRDYKKDLSDQIRTKVEDIFTKTDHSEARGKVVTELIKQLGIDDIIESKLKQGNKLLTTEFLLDIKNGFIPALAQELFDDNGKLKDQYIIKESGNIEKGVMQKLKTKKS